MLADLNRILLQEETESAAKRLRITNVTATVTKDPYDDRPEYGTVQVAGKVGVTAFTYRIRLTVLASCCGTLVLHEAYVTPEGARNRGVGGWCMGVVIEALRRRAARGEWGNVLIGTTTDRQPYGAVMAATAGFTKVGTAVRNPRTGNRIQMWRMVLEGR